MKRSVLCFLMLFASSSLLWAEDVTFEATVSSSRVSMDEILQLTLTITGVNQNLDPVSLPVIDGFTAKYVGPLTSTSFMIVNGTAESHNQRSFIYNLFPNKVGKFQIPAISATLVNQNYTTKPIDVEVYQAGDQTQAQAQASSSEAADQNQAPSAESIKEKILLVATVDKTDVYLNERIPLTIKLLVNGIPIRDIQYPQFDKQGILVDDFEKPEQSSGIFNGIRYDTVEFKTNIYPNHLGDLTLGPAGLQANILYRAGQANPDNNPFGTDVFSNFFDSYVTRPITVSSKPIVLHVSALPEDNRPNDFSGAIGQFDFQASVAPLQVREGDPLTLKMVVRGSGNFKNLQMPVFQAQGFKSYEPQIKNATDEKSNEVVIIPTSTAVSEVPALHFSYFDTALKDYRTLTQGPFAIHVVAPNPDQEFKAVGFSNLNPAVSTQAGKQFSFGKLFHRIYKFLGKLFRSILFWVIVGMILVAWLSYFLWMRFQERLENDPAFARRLKAVREARKALVPAGEFISSGRPKEFYALLSKVLRDYLANKWHLPSAGLSIDVIVERLKGAKMDEASIGQIKNILEYSDLVCFASAAADANKMRADLVQTQELVARLEKSLRIK